MEKGKFILTNGIFLMFDEFNISFQETQSPGFTEHFRAVRTSFPFFKETLKIIKLKFLLFNQQFPELTENDGAYLKRQMERTLTKNKHFLGAKVSLSFKFSEKKISYTIHSETTETADFELNEKGLFAEIFDKIQKPVSSLSTIALGSTPYWEIAESFRRGTTIDDFLIISTSDFVLETHYSNIYLISGTTVWGVSGNSGAYEDITKPLIIDICNKLNLFYSEDEAITIDRLNKADEIFTVNAIQGIRWIIGIGGKRYFNNITRKISELFKQFTIN